MCLWVEGAFVVWEMENEGWMEEYGVGFGVLIGGWAGEIGA